MIATEQSIRLMVTHLTESWREIERKKRRGVPVDNFRLGMQRGYAVALADLHGVNVTAQEESLRAELDTYYANTETDPEIGDVFKDGLNRFVVILRVDGELEYRYLTNEIPSGLTIGQPLNGERFDHAVDSSSSSQLPRTLLIRDGEVFDPDLID
jgi:hypothetical protein